jgi:hypothetical protein
MLEAPVGFSRASTTRAYDWSIYPSSHAEAEIGISVMR